MWFQERGRCRHWGVRNTLRSQPALLRGPCGVQAMPPLRAALTSGACLAWSSQDSMSQGVEGARGKAGHRKLLIDAVAIDCASLPASHSLALSLQLYPE